MYPVKEVQVLLVNNNTSVLEQATTFFHLPLSTPKPVARATGKSPRIRLILLQCNSWSFRCKKSLHVDYCRLRLLRFYNLCSRFFVSLLANRISPESR